jgi:hypothetical protein
MTTQPPELPSFIQAEIDANIKAGVPGGITAATVNLILSYINASFMPLLELGPGVQGAVELQANTTGGIATYPTGGGSPAGSNGQIQYNNSGAFGGLTTGSGVAAALANAVNTTGGIATYPTGGGASQIAFIASRDLAVGAAIGSSSAAFMPRYHTGGPEIALEFINVGASPPNNGPSGGTSSSDPDSVVAYTIQFEILAASPSGPVYSSKGSAVVGAASVSVPLPATVSTGDLLILEVLTTGVAGTVPVPSGWTQIVNEYVSGYTLATAVFYQKYAGGGAPTVNPGGTNVAGVISRVTGSAASPIGAVGSITQNASTTTIISNGITTSASNSLVYLALMAGSSGAAYVTPTGWAAAYDAFISGSGGSFEFAAVTQAYAGRGPAGDASAFQDSSSNWWTQVFSPDGVAPEQFGGGYNISSAYDDTTAIQDCVATGLPILLGAKTYYTSGSGIAGSVVPMTKIIGSGQQNTTIMHAGTNPFISYFTTIEMWGVEILRGLTLNAKFGVNVNGSIAQHGSVNAIKGGAIRDVVFYGAYSNADPYYGTIDIVNAASAYESCLTSTTISPSLTYDDVSSYGIAISLSQAFDWQIENCQFDWCGVGISFIGSDINHVINCRMHNMGWFAYDLRIASFGSQNKFDHCDLLYNYRAMGFCLNATNYFMMRDCYYENYNNSACLVYAAYTEGLSMTGNRIDDTTYGVTAPYPPLLIFDYPSHYNKVQFNLWQEFGSWVQTVIRVTNSGITADGYHAESLVVTDNSTWFPIVTTDTGTPYPGVRTSPLDPTRWDVTNTWRPIPAAPYVLQGAEYAIFASGGGTMAIPVKLPSTTRPTVYMHVRLETASGTTLTYSIRHYNSAGTVVETPASGASLTGLSASAYTSKSITVTLGVAPQPGDYLDFEWTGNLAYVSQVEVALVA